ncbi:MAG: DNA recombination protein RmuC [Candidatus Stahlbacteria bacterium]|nr:DNA recombination protein RmuC [Candidatus Stahlbacteria bacterium]
MIGFIIIGMLIVFILFFIIRTENTVKGLKNNEALGLMQQQMGQLSTQVTQQLQGMAQQLQSGSANIDARLDKATTTITGITRELGVLSQTTKQIIEAEKDIIGLQELLKPPKFRGGLGEFFLENLLAQILPKPYYSCQYGFKNGTKVDAVIHLRDKIVSVDSKFPLESFERIINSQNEDERKASRREFMKAVKKHIADIAGKYILPDEKTYDFALMYIPAENVYYETIIKTIDPSDNLFSFALEKRVIPVSPNSFYAYLQVIIEGLKGFKVEKWAKEIRESISRLQGDFTRFKEYFDITGKHLTNAKNKFDETERKLLQLGDKLAGTLKLEVTPLQDETKELLPTTEKLG